MPSKLVAVLAAGRGVVGLGAPSGAIAREIAAGGTGIMLDIAAPATWEADLRAAACAERAAVFGRRARARYEAEYGTARALAGWLDILREAAAAGSHSGPQRAGRGIAPASAASPGGKEADPSHGLAGGALTARGAAGP